MDGQAIRQKLTQRSENWVTANGLEHDPESAESKNTDPWLEIPTDQLFDVCRFLRDEPDLQFNMLHCITAIDFFEPDEKKAAKVDWESHLELVYHISSLVHRHKIALKTKLPRWKDDVECKLPEIRSVADIWRTAEWHEREVYDLSGVNFIGHPELSRILCPDDWHGHPLRKDYQVPDEYNGVTTK